MQSVSNLSEWYHRNGIDHSVLRPSNVGMSAYRSNVGTSVSFSLPTLSIRSIDPRLFILQTVRLFDAHPSINMWSFVYDHVRTCFLFGSQHQYDTYAFHESGTLIAHTQIVGFGVCPIIMGMDRDRYAYLLVSLLACKEPRRRVLCRIHIDRLFASEPIVAIETIESWIFTNGTSNGFVCDDGSIALFSSFALHSILRNDQ